MASFVLLFLQQIDWLLQVRSGSDQWDFSSQVNVMSTEQLLQVPYVCVISQYKSKLTKTPKMASFF